MNIPLISLIKGKDTRVSPKKTQRYALLCSTMSILLNLLLFGGKLLAATMSGSAAIMADAFNNLADAGTCGSELLGFTVAGFGAGEIHPFGHGRVEWLMGLIASVLVLIMGFEMAKASLYAIRFPSPLAFHPLTIVILAISIGVKYFMYCYNKYIGALISSVAMKAKAYDCLGDLAATIGTLLASLLAYFRGWQIDAYCGLGVSLLILYAGFQALKETSGPLMGSAPEPTLTDFIETTCLRHKEIIGVYDLMVHDYGFHRRMVSFHIGGSNAYKAEELVEIAAEISCYLQEQTGCETTIQIELLAVDEEAKAELMEQIESATTKIDPGIRIDQFRLIQHSQYKSVALDVVVPPEKMKLEEVVSKTVSDAIYLVNESYRPAVKVKMSAKRHTNKNESAYAHFN